MTKTRDFEKELKVINAELNSALIKIINKHGFLSPAQFSEKFGLSLKHVQLLCRQGKVGAFKLGRFWLLVDSQIYPKYRRLGTRGGDGK